MRDHAFRTGILNRMDIQFRKWSVNIVKKQWRFSDLVKKNREELLRDKQALEKIDRRLEEKHSKPKG